MQRHTGIVYHARLSEASSFSQASISLQGSVESVALQFLCKLGSLDLSVSNEVGEDRSSRLPALRMIRRRE